MTQLQSGLLSAKPPFVRRAPAAVAGRDVEGTPAAASPACSSGMQIGSCICKFCTISFPIIVSRCAGVGVGLHIGSSHLRVDQLPRRSPSLPHLLPACRPARPTTETAPDQSFCCLHLLIAPAVHASSGSQAETATCIRPISCYCKQHGLRSCCNRRSGSHSEAFLLG